MVVVQILINLRREINKVWVGLVIFKSKIHRKQINCSSIIFFYYSTWLPGKDDFRQWDVQFSTGSISLRMSWSIENGTILLPQQASKKRGKIRCVPNKIRRIPNENNGGVVVIGFTAKQLPSLSTIHPLLNQNTPALWKTGFVYQFLGPTHRTYETGASSTRHKFQNFQESFHWKTDTKSDRGMRINLLKNLS